MKVKLSFVFVPQIVMAVLSILVLAEYVAGGLIVPIDAAGAMDLGAAGEQ